MKLNSLFLMHYGSNTGYAISPLETLFFEVGMELSLGDPDCVHFGYADFERGPPSSLPTDFANVQELRFTDSSVENIQKICSYVKQHSIQFIQLFDCQPIHPLFAELRKNGVQFITSYYGAPISSLMPLWKLLLKKLQIRLSRSTLDTLIFESHAMASYAINGRGFPADRIDIVPLGVDVDLFNLPDEGQIYDRFGLDRSKRIFFYSGHMEHRKGVYLLVRAANILSKQRNDFLVVICGDRPGEKETVVDQADVGAIDHCVSFQGYQDALAELLASSYCGIIPSTGWDSFPRSMIEMSASGLPVIGSRLDGIPEGVLDGVTGLLFEPGDAEDLARKMSHLLDHPDEAERLGDAGKSRSRKEFNLDVQRKNLVGCIRRRLDTLR